MTKPCSLYRLFGDDDRLLYIGVSFNPERRLIAHRDKTWHPEVARMSTETFPTRGEALAAEEAAIKAERPAYNISHLAACGSWDSKPRMADGGATAARQAAFRQRQIAKGMKKVCAYIHPSWRKEAEALFERLKEPAE